MPDPLRDQRTALRRNQILDAAASVFAQQGYHPTTIKDVAREAGVADGTIYNYFDGKMGLLFGIFDRMTEAALHDEVLADLAGADLRSFLITYLRYPLMAHADDDFELFRVVISEIMVNAELRQQYHQRVLQPTLAIAEEHMRERYTVAAPHLTVRVLSATVMGLIMQRIMGDPVLREQWEDLPTLLADMILEGVAS